MRGKCEAKDAVVYMIVQIVAGIVAAITVSYFKGNPMLTVMTPDVPKALLNEFLFTFALVYVVLTVATSKKSAGNSYYGLAIGFTILGAAYAGGTISGGAYNPAVTTGITIMGLSSWSNIWIYLVACFAGGATAAMMYKIVNPDE